MRVRFERVANRLVARVAGDRNVEPGQPAFVRLPPERTLTFDAATGARVDDSQKF